MIALIPVRGGVVPAGSGEAIAECDGRAVVVGSDVDAATLHHSLDGLARELTLVELGPYAPARWTDALSPLLEGLDGGDVIVCPHSPDGRDLAPRLAAALARQLFAGATAVSPHRVRVARLGGLELHDHRPAGPFVATMLPGARGTLQLGSPPVVHRVDTATLDTTTLDTATASTARDAHVVEVLPPDVRTMDLTEAARIVGGGAGLDGVERFVELDLFAAEIGGVMGATRVITDRGWVHHDRQIGTTGVVVDPQLYVSFGVSGAVQHTSGLGQPDHIVSVNLDPHCPMMTMSDLAVVSDANETLTELRRLLAAGAAPEATPVDPVGERR
jgi:electron transfer flavoprotein alpha subunit